MPTIKTLVVPLGRRTGRSLSEIRRSRARAALSEIQRDAARRGLDRLSMEEIDGEIKAVRARRRAR